MLTIIIQGPVTNKYIQEFKTLERLLSFMEIEMIWCATELSPAVKMPDDTSMKIVSVPDCGPIPVKTLPHFSNTNRMFLTTHTAFSQITTKSSSVLKLRSDLKISDKAKFLRFVDHLISAPVGSLICVAQANHDWQLPYNLADWCFGGETNTVKTQVQRLTLIANNFGTSQRRTVSDFLFGYTKKGYSPKYTTEQIFGAKMFDLNLSKINTLASLQSWLLIKRTKLIIYKLQDAGLASSKHAAITRSKQSNYPLPIMLLCNLGKNILRAII